MSIHLDGSPRATRERKSENRRLASAAAILMDIRMSDFSDYLPRFELARGGEFKFKIGRFGAFWSPRRDLAGEEGFEPSIS